MNGPSGSLKEGVTRALAGLPIAMFGGWRLGSTLTVQSIHGHLELSLDEFGQPTLGVIE